MDQPSLPAEGDDNRPPEGAAHAVLARVELVWASGQRTSAALLHATRTMLVLEGLDGHRVLPPVGTRGTITRAQQGQPETGRLAEHGRTSRFLVSLGEREVRRTPRLRVSLPGVLRSPALAEPTAVEIADLTTGGARVRGVHLPSGTSVALDFTPPGRTEPVTGHALVAHATHDGTQP